MSQADDEGRKNEKYHKNTKEGARYSGAYVYGSQRDMWWVMMVAANGDHTWPVSFDRKLDATNYVKRKLKEGV